VKRTLSVKKIALSYCRAGPERDRLFGRERTSINYVDGEGTSSGLFPRPLSLNLLLLNKGCYATEKSYTG
jgi:hypothetical protein